MAEGPKLTSGAWEAVLLNTYLHTAPNTRYVGYRILHTSSYARTSIIYIHSP